MVERRVWVDYAKAIGIILVVYGHVARGVYHAGIQIPSNFYIIADTVIYSFHMPLFFFLAGLFFYKSLRKRGSGNLIISKIDTLVYPYVLWSIVQGGIEATLSGYTNGSVTYTEVFALLWSPRAQFWFLYALFAIYLFATLIFSSKSKLLALPVLLLSIPLYLYPGLLPDLLVFKLISNYFVFFSLGIVFSMYFSAQAFSKPWAVLVSGFAFALSQYLSFIYGLSSHLNALFLSMIGIVFVICLSAWASKLNFKIMLLIGSSSIAIYLMHILVTSGARVLLESMRIQSPVLHLLIGCSVGIFAPIMAFILIEKYKIPFVLSAPISRRLTLITKQPYRV